MVITYALSTERSYHTILSLDQHVIILNLDLAEFCLNIKTNVTKDGFTTKVSPIDQWGDPLII